MKTILKNKLNLLTKGFLVLTLAFVFLPQVAYASIFEYLPYPPRPIVPLPSPPSRPSPPTDVQAQDTPNDNGGSIDITWTASTSSDVTYIVSRSENSGGPYKPLNEENPTSDTSYVDKNVANGVEYYYVVQALYVVEALDEYWLSSYSNETSAVASDNIAPTVQSTDPTDNQKDIEPETNITISFSEEMKTSTLTTSNISVSGSLSGSVSGTISSTNNDGKTTVVYNPSKDFQSEETVTVVIKSDVQDKNGVKMDSDYTFSFQIKDFIAPAAPTDVQAQDTPNDNGGSIDITWTASTSSDVDKYIIYRSTSSGGPYTLLAELDKVVSYTDTKVKDGMVYYYVIVAQDASNNSSSYSQEASAYAFENNPPSEISNVQIKIENNSVVISWDNPKDSDFVGVIIVRRTNGFASSVTDGEQIYDGVEASFTDTDLISGATYYYTIFTYDIWNNYSTGVEVSAKITSSDESDQTSSNSPSVTPTPTPTPTLVSRGVVAGEETEQGVVSSASTESQEISKEEENLIPLPEEKSENKVQGKEAEASLISFFRPRNIIIILVLAVTASLIGYSLYKRKKE